MAAAFGATAIAPSAHATDGYFAHGYGVKSQGIAGVGIALPQDGLAAATNPAGTGLVGNRLDVGLTWFAPKRGAEIQGNAFGADQSYSGDGTKNFFIPEIGYTRQLNDRAAVGIAVYGNGGLNTEYSDNPFQRFGASGTAGVDLVQLFISPSASYRVAEKHTLGIALNVAYQRFEAKGLGPFTAFSSAPNNFTNQGTDDAFGFGVRVGWIGEITPELTLGATWASKTKSQKFDKYKGLFADGGSFDIPSNYGVGAAYRLTPALVISGDVKRIEYSGVDAVGNGLANLLAGNAFGSTNGPGFGWRDITIFKIGAAYDVTERFTVRGGFSHGTQPIPASETFLNILAPGVIRDHLSLGGTWKVGSSGELSVAYTHGFKETVNGSGSIPPGFPPAGFGGGEANIHLEQNVLGVAYGWRL